MDFLMFSILSQVTTEDRDFGCKFNSCMPKRNENVTKILATPSLNYLLASTMSLLLQRFAANLSGIIALQ